MTLLQVGLIFLSGFPILSTALLAYQLLRNGQGALGKPSITPWLFYPAKLVAGFLLVAVFWASIQSEFFIIFPKLIQQEIPEIQKLLSLVFILAGNLLLIPAYYSMSIFTRVGLPTKAHALQKVGMINFLTDTIGTTSKAFVRQ